KSIREFVATRDETCRMWGCSRRIRRDRVGYGADLDHATPWPKGEATPPNLSGLCGQHHLPKHTPPCTHQQHDDGTAAAGTHARVPAMTFPAEWVHTDEGDGAAAPGSPPPMGANELVAAFAEEPPY